jgi:hypothetical protein
MLTDNEKLKIRLEEEFRIEVKKQITDKKQNKGLVAFLNTNLGLFLLSSCTLSLITWGYTNYSTQLQEKNRKNNEINKLDIEITNRLEQLTSMNDTCDYTDFVNVTYALFGKNINNNATKTAVFEGYVNRNLFSLFYEYFRLSNKPLKDTMLNYIKELQIYYNEFEKNNPHFLSSESKIKFSEIHLKLDSWKQ